MNERQRTFEGTYFYLVANPFIAIIRSILLFNLIPAVRIIIGLLKRLLVTNIPQINTPIPSQ